MMARELLVAGGSEQHGTEQLGEESRKPMSFSGLMNAKKEEEDINSLTMNKNIYV